MFSWVILMTCTFFGHRDTSMEIGPILRETLLDLIENKNVTLFYVGNNGNFDYMVRKHLNILKKEYPFINYIIVLAYMPDKKVKSDYADDFETIYPEVLEKAPVKFAISKRNKWMIEQSDYVVTYVKHSIGGAAKFKKLAEGKRKEVINIAEMNFIHSK